MRRIPGVLVLLALLVAGCAEETGGGTEIANPSATFCVDQGGEYSLEDETCTLPDGRVVDAWDYYRSETGSAD